MIIGLGKRAVEGDSSVPSVHPQAMSSPGWFWNVWAPSSQSSSAPNYGSGTRPKPPVSSGENKPPLLSSSGNAESSWNSEGTVNLIPPETSTEIQNRPLRPLPTIQVGGRLETVPEEEAPEAVAQQISKPKPTGMFKGIFGKIFGKISKLKFWR